MADQANPESAPDMEGTEGAPPPPPPPPPPPAGDDLEMPSAAEGEGIIDPHNVGPAVGELGMFAQRAGKVAFGIMSAVLNPDEMVEVVVQGRYLGEDAIAALTSQRILLINSREWQPDVNEFPMSPTLEIAGWQDERTAALVFQDGEVMATFDQIADRPIAQRLAATLRSKVAELGG